MLGFFLFFMSLLSPLSLQASAACAQQLNPEFAKAKVFLKDTFEGGKVGGVAHFQEKDGGLWIKIWVWNVSPGRHGVHIHEFGDTSNKGLAAGGHYNPENAPHGYAPTHNFFNAHPGDLGNIEANDAGEGELEVFVPHLSLLKGRYQVAGRGLVLHEKEDDFSQPTGNAGGRIAVGSIFLVQSFDSETKQGSN